MVCIRVSLRIRPSGAFERGPRLPPRACFPMVRGVSVWMLCFKRLLWMRRRLKLAVRVMRVHDIIPRIGDAFECRAVFKV